MSQQYKFEDQPQKNKLVGDYTIYTNKKLGSGKYGVVYKGKSNTRNIEVAVKQSTNDQGFDEQKIKQIVNSREIQVMQRVKSENLVGFYDYHITKNSIYLFIELCEGGSLKDYMKKNQVMSDETIIDIFKQICKGFQALYNENIIHRDLKPDNILIHQGVIKIADFGFARFVDDPSIAKNYTLKGTPLYAPPQVFYGQKYSNQFDIWSFGCILYELAFGKTIHDSVSDLSQLKARLASFKEKKVEFPKTDRNPKIIEMISRMLEYHEEDRINWPQIFSSDMFLKPSSEFLEIKINVLKQDLNKQEAKLQNISIFMQLTEQFEKQNYDHFFTLKWKCILFYFWKFYLESLQKQIQQQNFIYNQKNGNKYSQQCKGDDIKINLGNYIDDLRDSVSKQLQFFILIVKQWIEKPKNLYGKTINYEELSLMSNIEKCENRQLLFFVEKYGISSLFTKEIDQNIKLMIEAIKNELV